MMVPSDRAAHMDVSAPCSATPSKFSFDTRALLGRHAVFVFVFLLCLVYAGKNLNRGWVPHDDGALAQSAERVLAGELPHRDFVEIYSGALDYLHALSFLLFGKTLISMRLMLLAAYLLWLPVVYRIALY